MRRALVLACLSIAVTVACSKNTPPVVPIVADDDAVSMAVVDATPDAMGADATDASKPAPSRPPLGSVAQIALGGAHSCALLDDGTVRCWGKNDEGQLGDGSLTTSSVPVPVKGLGPVAEIALGAKHTCARHKDGTMSCWGWNDDGELGDGTTVRKLSPVAVSGLKNVAGIALGSAHTCARLDDKTVRCFGLNHVGQLGDGTTTTRHVPTAATGLANVVEIEARGFHTCARLASAAAWCWGSNREGELCDGITRSVMSGGTAPHMITVGLDRSLPGAIPGVLGVIDLALGGLQTCIRRTDGSVSCCGNNSNGQLGNGTFAMSRTPAVIAAWKGATQVALGANHMCALVSGKVLCAGSSHYDQLDSATITGSMSTTPVEIAGLSDVADLAVGAFHSCIRTNAGNARCWGQNVDGQLGDGSNTKTKLVVTVVR